MKVIRFVRHAKSSWKHNVDDFNRPLKKRGLKDAILVSNYLKINFIQPQLVWSSDALRALKTAEIFMINLDISTNKLELKNELYDFSGKALLDAIKSCDNFIDNIMIFGHNYAITNLCNSLGNIAIDNVTTSGFVQIEFDQNSWKNIQNGKTTKIVFPKHLK